VWQGFVLESWVGSYSLRYDDQLEANVVITPGSGFGSKGEGYFRVSAFNGGANAEEVARRLTELEW